MLPRVLEPEIMDSARDADEYDQMDHDVVNRTFVNDLLTFLVGADDPAGSKLDIGDILDVGTGTAQIPVELGLRPQVQCRIVAVDLAASMLDLAVYNLAAKGLESRVTLAQADAKQLHFDSGLFDIVISNSLIHHLPEPKLALQEMLRVVRPQGAVFIRDLIRPVDQSELARLVARHAGNESEYSQRLLADSLQAALTLDEVRSIVAELGFQVPTVQATSDRHWTWATRLR